MFFLAFNQYTKHCDQSQVKQYENESGKKGDYISETLTHLHYSMLTGFNAFREDTTEGSHSLSLLQMTFITF